jgi:hypothetical protein
MGCVPGVVSVGLILVTPIPPTVRRDLRGSRSRTGFCRGVASLWVCRLAASVASVKFGWAGL